MIEDHECVSNNLIAERLLIHELDVVEEACTRYKHMPIMYEILTAYHTKVTNSLNRLCLGDMDTAVRIKGFDYD